MRKQFFDISFGTLRLALSILAATFFALCSPLLTPCSTVAAQQPKKIPLIGYLSNADPATESIRSEAIQQALRKLGYIEGQSIATEYRYVEGKNERAPELRPSWCVSRLISSWQQEGAFRSARP